MIKMLNVVLEEFHWRVAAIVADTRGEQTELEKQEYFRKNYKNLNPEGQRCEDDRSDVGVVSSQFQQCLDGGTVLSWVAKGRTVLLQKDRS